MNGIAIYVEGGGDGHQQKATLRQGFDGLLSPWKEKARSKRLHWKLVCAGDGRATFDAWQYALSARGNLVSALLVDSETALPNLPRGPAARVAHLAQRGWAMGQTPADRVHLMVQCMEAWIVADPEALEQFYGQGFLRNALPARANLEDEPKPNLLGRLDHATRSTQKGTYQKIRHASPLLQAIDPSKVAARCAHFGVLTGWLDAAIRAA